MSGELGSETRKKAMMKTTAKQVLRGRGQMRHHNQEIRDGAGGGCRARGAGQEESADESAKWSSAELEGLATEEEEATNGGVG